MRLVSPGGGGGALEMPWSKNPLPVAFTFSSGNVAPHASTVRWSYTVPAGRRCQVNYIGVGCWRRTTPTTPDIVYSFVQLNPGGAGFFIIAIARLTAITDNDDAFISAPQFIMNAGDLIRGQTLDGSVGGTCDYLCAFVGTEFDA